MTCTSDRSGSASSGVFVTATTPPMTTNKVASRIRNGFLPDHWMILASTASSRQWPLCEPEPVAAGADGTVASGTMGPALVAAAIDVTTYSPGCRSTNSKDTDCPGFRPLSRDGLAALNSIVIAGHFKVGI